MKHASNLEKIIETSSYKKGLAKISHKGLDRDKLNMDVQDIIEGNPLVGVVIPGGGGVRKFRHQIPGVGKRGGCRVVYYYHDGCCPIYMLDIFAKNEREDLTQAEKAMFAQFVRELKRIYHGENA